MGHCLKTGSEFKKTTLQNVELIHIMALGYDYKKLHKSWD